MTEYNKIFLWTTCRCLSTVIERPFIQNKDVKVIHEPFSAAYYLGPEKTSVRYKYEEMWANETYQNISDRLKSENHNGPVVIKDMAYNIKKQYNLINEGFVHTFLIRNPLKVGLSLHKLISTSTQPEINFFDPIEMSFEDIYHLHNYVTTVLGQKSIIIDADDVLNDPMKVYSKYCSLVGIEFNESMLSWTPEVVNNDWLIWKGWHDDAINSTSFEKAKELTKTIDDLPDEIKECVIYQTPFYNKLYELRI